MATASERMQELLLSQFDEKPVIYAILQAVGVELDRIEKVRNDINSKIYPDVAVGEQLDMCGEVAGIDRNEITLPKKYFGFPSHGDISFGRLKKDIEDFSDGLVYEINTAPFRRLGDSYLEKGYIEDEYYRLAVKDKINKNWTDCSRESTIESLKLAFGEDTPIVIANLGNAKFRLGVGRDVTAEEMAIIEALNLIIRGAGIGIGQMYTFSGNTFGFSRHKPDGELYYPKYIKTFGQGKFARVYGVNI